ncbi:DUF2199 domain-containing protein [Kibdelosporangium aridum]|uniref:Uncharacterized protein n=1 Tax=Kibdelosporangium aridum TaxID=2030 RepID=A0A1W2BLF3_KIBAR|nr:DUF2199 domain-containing protein [Kibdelosporangium aridum]SMC73664.1 hypothetical protein SAMN05661093_01795 [Kibdelosporangium aridum]
MAERISVRMERVDRTWSDPSEEQLYDLISELNLRHQFLIVDRVDAPNDEYYMQLRISDDFSYYDIEYRDGGPDAHFTAVVSRENEFGAHDLVAQVISLWASGQDGWREALPWERWTPARCGCCGELIETTGQIDFGFDLPDVAYDKSDTEVEKVNLRLVRVDGEGGFVRCVMPVALTDDLRLVLGVWVRVSDADFEHVVSVWSEQAYQDLVVQGTLANMIRPWGHEIYEAPLTAAVHEADKIPVVDASEHPVLHRVLTETWERDHVLSYFADALPVSFQERIGEHWSIERSAGLSARVDDHTVRFAGRYRTVLIDQFDDRAGRSVDEFLDVLLDGGPQLPDDQMCWRRAGDELRHARWMETTVDGHEQNEVHCFVVRPGRMLRAVCIHDAPADHAWAMHVFNSMTYRP